MLHVHGNAKDSEEGFWTDHILKSINEISKSEGGTFVGVYEFSLSKPGCLSKLDKYWFCFLFVGYSWDISIEHVERVKWYAPHIRHLVVDVRCKLSQR